MYHGMDCLIMNNLLRTLYVCESAGRVHSNGTLFLGVQEFYSKMPRFVKEWTGSRDYWDLCNWFEIEPFNPLSTIVINGLDMLRTKLKRKRDLLQQKIYHLDRDLFDKERLIQQWNADVEQRRLYAKWLKWGNQDNQNERE